jgi:hypothetical protein
VIIVQQQYPNPFLMLYPPTINSVITWAKVMQAKTLSLDADACLFLAIFCNRVNAR